MTETKAERFARVSVARVNKALDAIDKIRKCADRRMYDYTPDQIAKILNALAGKQTELQELFATPCGRRRFSLKSGANWFLASADGGQTWAEQLLTAEEVTSYLAAGYVLKKRTIPTQGLEETT